MTFDGIGLSRTPASSAAAAAPGCGPDDDRAVAADVGDRDRRTDRSVLDVRRTCRSPRSSSRPSRAPRRRCPYSCSRSSSAQPSSRRPHRAADVPAPRQAAQSRPLRLRCQRRSRLDRRRTPAASTTPTRLPLTTICAFGNCFLSSFPTEISVEPNVFGLHHRAREASPEARRSADERRRPGRRSAGSSPSAATCRSPCTGSPAWSAGCLRPSCPPPSRSPVTGIVRLSCLPADELAVGDLLAAARDDAVLDVRRATGTPSWVEARSSSAW